MSGGRMANKKDSTKCNVNVMGCQVQRGFANTNLLSALHQRNFNISLKVTDANAQPIESCSSMMGSLVRQTFSETSILNNISNISRSTCYNLTNNCTRMTQDPREGPSAFLGGYPMLPSSDPLFLAFSSSMPRSRNTGCRIRSATPEIDCSSENTKEIFARKVFIGGLPFDVSQAEITSTFSQFGRMFVDYPYRTDVSTRVHSTVSVHSTRSMKGYVFIVFDEERSVRRLVSHCHRDGDDYYLLVSSPTMRNKPVQVRPWRLADINYELRGGMILDVRRTVFIGGVPRPTKAGDLALLLENLYGPVCYAGIDIDPELKYPKGAGRVTFATTAAFLAAINGRFARIACGDITKRVEIKPYMMDEQMCDECNGTRCLGKYAPYFCGDVACLQYFCENSKMDGGGK
uniref:RRM domain-containing protein n=1 Tax=Parascaris univalens TaxID=6257 RepID=A0A914ZML5_PARUN